MKVGDVIPQSITKEPMQNDIVIKYRLEHEGVTPIIYTARRVGNLPGQCGPWMLNRCGTSCAGHSWAAIINSANMDIVVIETPDEKASETVEIPAIYDYGTDFTWNKIEYSDVRLGDILRILTNPFDDSRQKVPTFIFGECTDAGEPFWIGQSVDIYPVAVKSIYRATKIPMPEPDAPAVVKHAGQIWIRQEMTGNIAKGNDWWPLSLSGGKQVNEWLSWEKLRALDPTTDPVVVDLGEV